MKLHTNGFIFDRTPHGFKMSIDGPGAQHRAISECVLLGAKLEAEKKNIVETRTSYGFDAEQGCDVLSVECKVRHRLVKGKEAQP